MRRINLLNIVVTAVVGYFVWALFKKYVKTDEFDNLGVLPGQGSDSSEFVQIGDKKILVSLVKLVDDIYNKLHGVNMYSYPDVVNRLANLSKANLWNAIHYYNYKYKGATGYTLYWFIKGECAAFMSASDLDFSCKYQPALNVLEQYGWKNQ